MIILVNYATMMNKLLPSVIDTFQVSLACKHRKPLVIHERDAHKELVEILNDFIQNLPAIVIHCFSGSVEEAQDYLNLGCYLGISGKIT